MADKSENQKSEKIQVYGDDLKISNIWSYGFGHFMNDICASSWFFLLSYYLIQIIQIDKHDASYIILAGQIADAIATPIVGILSDKTETRFGKRTPWYFCGTILVAISFSLIFFSLLADDAGPTAKLVYYSIFASFFNIGWASVQVSHMALLPSITLSKKKKDFMTRIRTGFTFLAQTLTLLLSVVFFKLISNKIMQYKVLAGTSIIFGILFSVIFLVLCKEHELSKNIPLYYEKIKNVISESNNKSKNSNTNNENSNTVNPSTTSANKSDNNLKVNLLAGNSNKILVSNENIQVSSEIELSENTNSGEEINWIYWMKKPDFYYYIIVYMFVRLSINITSTIIPFFMELVLGYPKTADGGTPYEITVCLLISTLGSIFNSLFLQKFIEISSNTGNKRIVLIIIANIFVALGCIPLYFLSEDLAYPIYFLGFIWGIGFSQGLSCVSSLINDVVGSKGNKGAFVYGAFSFADKLSCGIVLLFYLPVASENKDVLRLSIPFFPPAALVFAVLFVWLRRVIKGIQEKSNYNKIESDGENGSRKGNDNEAHKEKNLIDHSRLTFITNHDVSTNLKKLNIGADEN